MATRTLEGDPVLLAAFRRGEREALTEVFRLYVDDVAHAVRSGVRVTVDGQMARVGVGLSETELEVVVQDTFCEPSLRRPETPTTVTAPLVVG